MHSKIKHATADPQVFAEAKQAANDNSKRERLEAASTACSAELPGLQTVFKAACASAQAAADPEACKAAKTRVKTTFKECKLLLRDVNQMKKDAKASSSSGGGGGGNGGGNGSGNGGDGNGGGGGGGGGSGGAGGGSNVLAASKGRLGGIADIKWGSPQTDLTACIEKQVRLGGEAKNEEEANAMSVECALQQGHRWSDPIQMNIANHCPTQSILLGKGSTHLSATPELLPKFEFELGPGESGRWEGYEREIWVVFDSTTAQCLDQWALDVSNGVVQDFVVDCKPKSEAETAKFVRIAE